MSGNAGTVQDNAQKEGPIMLRKSSMFNLSLFLGSMLFAISITGVAVAQQDLCSGKVRHVTCHYADGKMETYDTDPKAQFYNTRPAMTFMTTDGNLHLIFGGCDIVCHP